MGLLAYSIICTDMAMDVLKESGANVRTGSKRVISKHHIQFSFTFTWVAAEILEVEVTKW